MDEQKKHDNDLLKKRVARTMDYKRIFNSEQGRRVLRDLINAHFVMTSTYIPGDSVGTIRNEGERNVILRILKILETDELKMKQLIEESGNV